MDGERERDGTHGQGEIFSQRVSFEPVVGQDSSAVRIKQSGNQRQQSEHTVSSQIYAFLDSQIRVTRKEDAKHVPHLPLVPIRSPEQPRGRGHRRDLVRVRLDPDPTVMRITQEVVDHLEPVRTGRDVHGRNVHDALVLAPVVVPQELEHGEDAGGGGVEGEFVLVDGELLDVFRETGGQVLAVGVERRGEGGRVGGRVGREFLGKGRDRALRDVGCGQEGTVSALCWSTMKPVSRSTTSTHAC